MAVLSQSVVYTRMFKMVSSSDHFTAKTGAGPTVNLSKAGAAFGAAAGAVSEVASGWYKVALSAADTNTLGDLAYYITGSGADDTDFVDQVVVAPGAAGGATICGSNAATTFVSLTCTGAFTISDGLIISTTTATRPGLSITGNTTGAGILATGGNAAPGIKAVGIGAGGHGIHAISGTTAATAGIYAAGGATNATNGMAIVGGSTSGAGLVVSATSGVGMAISSASGGGATISAGTAGAGLTITGVAAGGHGLYCISGTTAATAGICAAGGATNATNGMKITGGSTSGVALAISTTSGDSITAGTITQTGAVSWGATTYASLSVTGQMDAGNLLVDTTTVLTGTVGTGAVTLNGLAITNALSVGTTTTLTGAVATGAVTLSGLAITNALSVGTTTTLTGNVVMGGAAGLAVTNGIAANITGNITGTLATVTTLTNLPTAAALEATLTLMKGATFDTATDSLEAIRNKLPTNLEDMSITDTTGLVTMGHAETGSIDSSSFAAGAIDASAIASNAIGAAELASDVITDIWQGTAITEAYAADNAAATPAQLLYMIWSSLSEFVIAGTTITAKKLDGSTTAMTFTLDSSTDPTSRTRAS